MTTSPRFRPFSLAVLGACGLLAACAAPPPAPVEPEEPPEQVVTPALVNETAMLPLLGYYHLLQRMAPAELARERQTLAGIPASPSVRVRQAMLLGMPRTTGDLPRALALLDAVLRAREPEAASLHPLARLLAVQYQERMRLEAQGDRLGQQLKDSQRRRDELQEKRDELQEKLDALTDIERSMPVRPNAVRPAP